MSSSGQRHPPIAARRESAASGQARFEQANWTATDLVETTALKEKKIADRIKAMGEDLPRRLQGMKPK